MRPSVFAVILLNMVMVTACATKGPMDIGAELYQEGRYAEAIDQFTKVIQNPQYENEFYLSYFQRAEAYKAMGSYVQAFHDYYAAKVASCYLIEQEKKGNLHKVGRVPWLYCNQAADDKMAAVAADIPEADRKAIMQKVDTELSGLK